MKKMTKTALLALAILAMLATSMTAFAADFGSGNVTAGETYTLNEMLTYAMQDEYMALAEYTKITQVFGAQRPFSNIMKAETQHIALLTPLFEKYNVKIPGNTASDYVVVPKDITSALKAGADAEVKNIAMYEQFLKQNLPDDVKGVFTSLINASKNHLNAFTKTGGSGRSSASRGRPW